MSSTQNQSGQQQQTGQQNQSGQQQQQSFPSAELLFGAIQREYDKEDERASTLDTRVGILTTVTAALLAFIPTYISIPDLKKVKVDNVLNALPYTFYFLFIIITILCLVCSLVYCLRIIGIKTYNRVDLSGFTNPGNIAAPTDVVAKALTITYRQNIEHNGKVNDQKVKLYTRGVYCIAAAIISAVIIYIFNIFIK
ncbi:hypothetical protein ABES02_25275 [Neobacillus pocheonensis]|uniref:hypothetical protein n=1 Tax=Neobacillus pocheonensis TaxID=363869 RepID=UPI003D2E1109